MIAIFVSVLVWSCIFTVSTASETIDSQLRRGVTLTVNDGGDDVKELYITQRLDHFDRANGDTYHQRYFVSYRHQHISGAAAAAARSLPIISLLCVGGEGPGFDKSVLTDSVHCSGDMLELAKRIAAQNTHTVHLYALEHRYYGKSYPKFEDQNGNKISPLTVENLRYLSSRQALEDLAHFVHTMNQKTGTSKDNSMNTWVTFGGSYPGLMSLYARYKYPHLVFASVSSSAPLQLKVDFPGYKARQGWDLKYDKIGGSDECHRIVKEGHEQAVALVKKTSNKTDNSTVDGPTRLAKKFNVCQPKTALQKRRNQELLLGDGLININSQSNDPSCTGDELCNIAELCQFMIQQVEGMTKKAKASDDPTNNIELDVLAKVAQKQYQSRRERQRRRNNNQGKEQQQQLLQMKTKQLTLLEEFQQYDDDCIDVNYEGNIEYYASEEIKPFGGRSWLWQTCTEMGFYQTCTDDEGCPFASHYHQIDMDLEICSRLFNITNDSVYENVQASLDLYGGKEFLDSGASNILTINGNVDPWSVLGLEESDSANYKLPVKMVEGASHHFWTHAVKDTDALEIIKIREYIYSCVMNWLGIDHSNSNGRSNGVVDDLISNGGKDENLWSPSVSLRQG